MLFRGGTRGKGIGSILGMKDLHLPTGVEAEDLSQGVIQGLRRRLPISKDLNKQRDEALTFGDRVSDALTAFGGSWTFILLFLGVLGAWVLSNTVILTHWGRAFDPYPFIFLNLVLSMIAALQAPVIMMSQNRQAANDRLAAEHDYEVNLKAELEILALHEKLDALRERQWAELVAMQQEQIQLLTALLHEKESS